VSLADLLSRRLLFTVGKGGVGRTTVTVALALEAVRRGKRVLVIEFEGARGLERALDAHRQARDPAPGLDRLTYLAVDGKRALEEYLEMIIPVRRLLRTIFDSAIYQYFVAAAPGLKELMAIGKIWYEANRADAEGDPRAANGNADDGPHPDLVIVDAPATGHSLQYLRMPQAAHEAFPVGLVHREAERVLSLLRDPSKTGVVVVSIAEEMPANETLEILAGLEGIGLQHAALVVNQVHAAPCSEEELDALRREAETVEPLEAAASDAALFVEAVRRAEEESGWARINATHVARLEAATRAPVALLPYVFCEEFGPEQVREIGRVLRARFEETSASAKPRGVGRGRAS